MCDGALCSRDQPKKKFNGYEALENFWNSSNKKNFVAVQSSALKAAAGTHFFRSISAIAPDQTATNNLNSNYSYNNKLITTIIHKWPI